MIESLSNAKIKHAYKLRQKKYRSEFGEFLVEGEHLVEEAVKSGQAQLIFTSYPISFLRTETELVSEAVMKKLSELNEEKSVIAICSQPQGSVLGDRVLLLDSLQDPGNMGTLIRTAAAFGFRTIIAEDSVDYYNDKVIRGSQGAIFYVDLLETNIKDFIQSHREYRYYGTDVHAGVDIRQVEFAGKKVALILGNEGSGVRDDIKKLADINVNIPMESTESLNVGIAGGILMYETFRRK